MKKGASISLPSIEFVVARYRLFAYPLIIPVYSLEVPAEDELRGKAGKQSRKPGYVGQTENYRRSCRFIPIPGGVYENKGRTPLGIFQGIVPGDSPSEAVSADVDFTTTVTAGCIEGTRFLEKGVQELEGSFCRIITARVGACKSEAGQVEGYYFPLISNLLYPSFPGVE
ncbi:MAG: hypothetical protein R6V67_03760 [Spirochaetia bacterium]